jgi:hypothetical protein
MTISMANSRPSRNPLRVVFAAPFPTVPADQT